MEVNSQESLTRLDLPEEIWINIFRRLDVKSVQNAQLVCKKWLDFILSDVILSGEYRFASCLSSSQINGFLAKRKKLKSVHFPSPYEYKKDEDSLYLIFDFVDFKVCKDLKKVTVETFVEIPPLPKWVMPSSFWFDPYNKPESYGPENIVELTLRCSTYYHELGIPDDSSIELVTKKMTHLEKLKVYLYAEDTIDYILPLLKGLQHCHSLHQLEIFCNPGDMNILSLLLYYISEWCPRISYLKMEPSEENYKFKSLEWCSSIAKFRNLEKLEIGLYLVPSRNWQEDESYLDMDGDFYENPMTKLKELKLNTVNVFFQDGFLCRLQRFFPNLQTFNLAKLGHQGDFEEVTLKKKVSCWTFSQVRETLRSLGSIKNLCLTSMEIVLEPWSGLAEHAQTFRKTERIFYQALEIINKQFPLSIGDLKIIDEEHGFVIIKEKMKPPKMFNQQQINGRSVVKVEHFEDSKTVRLKLKPKGRKGRKKNNEKNEKEEEIVLSGELIKRLYLEHIGKSSIYN